MVFFIAVAIIGIIGVLMFRMVEAPENSRMDQISEFKITEISGNGKIYLHNKPINDANYSTLSPVNIKQMQYKDHIYIKADPLTAFEFFCSGFSFIASPDSYLFFQPKTRELYLFSGEFYWVKLNKKQKGNVSVSIQAPQNVLILPDSGRAKITGQSVNVWNFANSDGAVKFNFNGEDLSLNQKQLFTYQAQKRGRQKAPVITDILPMPQGIDPVNKDIILENPENSIVRFNWSVLKGEARYVFRLYSSRLRENLLTEQYIDINRASVELLQFDERKFFWEVYPVSTTGILMEGVPSKMGFVRLLGMLNEKKDIKKPPSLVVEISTISGNTYFARGKADPTSTLYVNGKKEHIDTDGQFNISLKFMTLGRKEIVFRLVSPFKVETIHKEYIDVNEI
jgi:hypothetical protein